MRRFHKLFLILLIISISFAEYDYMNCEFVSRTLGGPCQEVFSSDEICCASGGGLFMIMDSSDPENPDTISSIYTPGIIQDIEVYGNVAVTANLEYGVFILDVSNPEMPIIKANFECSEARAVAIEGAYLLVADGAMGMRILNIADPAYPFELAREFLSGIIYDIEKAGSYAYLASGGVGLQIMDISSPASPRIVSTFSFENHVKSIAVVDDIAYVGSGPNFYTVDISVPIMPLELDHISTYSEILDISILGDLALVATHGAGLRLVNVSRAYSLTEDGNYGGWTRIHSVGIAGDFAAVAMGYDGFFIADVSRPYMPIERGYFDTPGSCRGITIRDDILFAADNYDGLMMIDIENPEVPLFIGSYHDISKARNVDYTEGHAFIAGLDGNLMIVNVEDPDSTYLVTSYDLFGQIKDIVIRGDYAYIAAMTTDCEANKLKVLDISDPSSYTEVAELDIQAAFEIILDGNFAYITQGNDGIRIIDITDPRAPETAGSFNTDDIALGIDIQDGIAYITDSENGVVIADFTDPYYPVEIGQFDTEYLTLAIDVYDHYAFVACEYGGLRVYDITDLEDVVLAGYFSSGGYAWDIKIHDEYAIISYGDHGIYILDITETLTAVYENPFVAKSDRISLTSYPNPFNSATTIELAGDADYFDIYDTQGMFIERIQTDNKSLLNSSAKWIPGNHISSGAYLVVSPENKATSQIIYIK